MDASERAELEELVKKGHMMAQSSDKDTLISSLATLVGRHIAPPTDDGEQGKKSVILATARYLVDLYGNDAPLREEFGDFDKDLASAMSVLANAPDDAIIAAIFTLVGKYIVNPSSAVHGATEEDRELTIAIMSYRHIAMVGLKIKSLTSDQSAKLSTEGKLAVMETSDTVH
jgi:hypothetical protein